MKVKIGRGVFFGGEHEAGASRYSLPGWSRGAINRK